MAGISQRQITLPNGIRLRVVVSGPRDGKAVLLVHGWGGCIYSYEATIPALAAAGYRAVAIDLPGHGLSDKPVDESHYTTPALASAVIGAADALGIDRFAYVGHSMGGALGFRMAEAGERRVERLIAISAASLGSAPIIGVVKALSPRFINRVVPPILTRFTIRMILKVAFATPHRPTPRDLEEYWATTQFDEGAWACRALLHRFTFDEVPDATLRSLELPVLVIAGGRDRIVFKGEERAALIRRGRVVAIAEGGHLVMQECASRANAEILAFLGAS